MEKHDSYYKSPKKEKSKIYNLNRPEGKIVTDKDYENDHRTKPVSFSSYNKSEYVDSSVQIIDNNVGKLIVTTNRKVVVMNKKVDILTHIIQLITKSFDALLHV